LSSLLDPYAPLLIYLGIWGLIILVGYLLKAEKHGLVVKPYYFMLKTVIFNSWMERIGGRFRRFWLTFFDIGAALGIGLLFFAIFTFVLNIFNLLFRTKQAGPTLLIIPLPGITISWEIFPYILISIAILLIPHEAAHGIASVIDKVPIKSSGVFLAVFLPGGFVEIDEEDLSKRPSRTKLRVFAAGSSTNVATWFLVFLLFSNFALVISPLYQTTSSGVLVTGLANNGGAEKAGIQQWSVITGLNGTQMFQPSDLAAFLVRINETSHPSTVVTVALNNGETKSVTTTPAPGNSTHALLGITTFPFYAPRYSNLPVQFPFQIASQLNWLLIILLGVGIVNMLPLFPFDGDRYFDTILGALGLKSEADRKIVRTLVGIAALSLLLGNLVLSYILFGTVFPS
jgi:membrane-associated protease RseP (regulator of RpoE activity)